MTQRDLFRIAARLLAVYIAILAVHSLGSFLGGIATILVGLFGDRASLEALTATIKPSLLTGLLTFLLYAVFILSLWRNGDRLADRVLGPSATTPIDTGRDSELGLLALRLFAIWLMVIGLIGLIAAVAAGIWNYAKADEFDPPLTSSLLTMPMVKELLQPVPTLLAGFLVLKLGPRWIRPNSLPNA